MPSDLLSRTKHASETKFIVKYERVASNKSVLPAVVWRFQPSLLKETKAF